MQPPVLTRYESCGVTLLGDRSRPGGVTLAFTERTGGVSQGAYATLNLGDRCGDDQQAVATNRLRVLEAISAHGCVDSLVNPRQVHGDHVVCIREDDEASVRMACEEARNGADAVVCVVPRVPVLLCFADCVPVICVCEGGFAVIHSGWRGTMARISAMAVDVLACCTGSDPSTVHAYIGPHIGMRDYEVSWELARDFKMAFGPSVVPERRLLDLGRAVTLTLCEAGIEQRNIASCELSTASATDRFFSFRAENGRCGRHGAIACLGLSTPGQGDGATAEVSVQ
jgi:YfiH family protein